MNFELHFSAKIYQLTVNKYRRFKAKLVNLYFIMSFIFACVIISMKSEMDSVNFILIGKIPYSIYVC